MDERNIHGLIISVLIIIGLIIVLFFIVNNDRKRVDSLTVEEIENKNVEDYLIDKEIFNIDSDYDYDYA